MEEQWKGDGNCRICRKRRYCKTECGASKRQRERMMRLFAGRAISAAAWRAQEHNEMRNELREAARATCTPHTEKSLDAVCARLRQIAAESPFTTNALAESVAELVRKHGFTLEDATSMVEHELNSNIARGVSDN